MNRLLVLALGLGARALSLVSGLLSDWLLTRLAEGAVIFDIAQDACELGGWLISAIAHYLGGNQPEPSYYN
ncbi:MAG: hypothetical protein JNM56_11130 [Planctomycetia bacterium]|nr:hypothetical protein [Planctomycetia bacterium]